ncbi:hypothetical protein A374_10715 [Fictibacillus macauensis ZFHKF-1]|uniref:YqzL family protein n=1 Tax=Fictibacillus macauensis ZFHKF-1 TaxID=1196324 RepID=I8AIB1_9BACL|nr:YqzL family protein [Fictibacillus macauensis]EIT85209.1 hypothetical protein A374_10715 [Fictibacillus macauensis ZFHKF-1]
MKEFTWKVFCETGNIDTYLLFKELEGDVVAQSDQPDFFTGLDAPIQ